MKTPALHNTLPLAATLLLATLTLAGIGQAQQTSTAKPATAATAKKAPVKTTAAPVELKTEKDKLSYAIGMSIAHSVQQTLKRDDIEVDPAMVAKGLKAVLEGEKTLLTEKEAQDQIVELQKTARANQEAKAKAAGEANKKDGDAFLAANKSKDGVVTLADGLQYKVIKQGDGPKPTASDTVECNYRGTLIDGKEFDSSYKRGQPASFSVGGVIKGWTEVLQLMPVGSKYQVFIPAELAYGARGAGADIGPNATLIFEIELLSIKSKASESKPVEMTKPSATAQPAEATKPAAQAK
jgi:FKBP-type peptidyl-prolyl cis-trans isomerase